MVELKISSGSTVQTKNTILALLAAAGPENIAEIIVKDDKNIPMAQGAKTCLLTILLHLDGQRKDGKPSLASAGDIQLITNEFSYGFSGTGPSDLLEVLRAAGVTPEMLPEVSILSPSSKRLNICFSARYYCYGKLREISPVEEPKQM